MGKKLQCSCLGTVVEADLEGKEGEITILGMRVGCCASPLRCCPGGLHLCPVQQLELGTAKALRQKAWMPGQWLPLHC